jgi:Transposase DDE domain group 1
LAGFAECFIDRRRPELVEHLVATLVGQRVFGIALGYEDVNDHDKLRHDPVMAVLALASWQHGGRTVRRWRGNRRSTGWS